MTYEINSSDVLHVFVNKLRALIGDPYCGRSEDMDSRCENRRGVLGVSYVRHVEPEIPTKDVFIDNNAFVFGIAFSEK